MIQNNVLMLNLNAVKSYRYIAVKLYQYFNSQLELSITLVYTFFLSIEMHASVARSSHCLVLVLRAKNKFQGKRVLNIIGVHEFKRVQLKCTWSHCQSAVFLYEKQLQSHQIQNVEIKKNKN